MVTLACREWSRQERGLNLGFAADGAVLAPAGNGLAVGRDRQRFDPRRARFRQVANQLQGTGVPNLDLARPSRGNQKPSVRRKGDCRDALTGVGV